MKIKLVADIHGEVDALREALKPEDTVVLLGDLLNWVDFASLEGMLSEILEKHEIAQLLEEIGRGNLKKAKTMAAAFLKNVGVHHEKLRSIARSSYRELFSAIPCRTYVIYGNTDYPDILKECLPPDAELIETGCLEISGARFGFVSGVPPYRWGVGLPGEIDAETYRKWIGDLGPVDVLCTHFPPAYPELTFDVVAKRSEEGSGALAEFIEKAQPEYALFGHVHQPREKSRRVGRSKLINAGYFRREKKAFELEL